MKQSKSLEGLGSDILQYFGLGCRNVAKVYFLKIMISIYFLGAYIPMQKLYNMQNMQIITITTKLCF